MTLQRRHFIGGLPVFVARAAGAEPASQTTAPQIYAAMTFRVALDAVLRAYRETGGAAAAVYGPTPVLVHQLEAGAPGDILLTADPDWMNEAARLGLIRTETRSDLLANDLVLAGPPDAASVSEITSAFALAELLAGGRIALCDPDHDPAGRYAKQSLQLLGLWDLVASRLAVTESSLLAASLVDRGEVRAAVCFATDLHGDAHAKIVGRFPARSHAPVVYPVALTQHAAAPQAARALTFLRGSQAQSIFVSFGYRPPS